MFSNENTGRKGHLIREIIDGAALRDMFLMGAAQLEKNKSTVDALNVFPVPDGDTGTNMSMTMQGAVKELRSMPETVTVGEVTSAVSKGALRSARGNSGVILSQLFRGFSKALKGMDTMDARLFSQALSEGTQAAYKAVMKPTEGTILTVSRMVSDAVQSALEENASVSCDEIMDLMLKEGEAALKLTPELLPVLKEAGVVDSGGRGLMFIYTGFWMALEGEDVSNALAVEEASAPADTGKSLQDSVDFHEFDTDTIEYGYCTEFFIIHLVDGFEESDLDRFRSHLEKVGNSIVAAYDGEMVKVHVHSNCPGKILQMALRYGELDRLKIENMREQNRQLIESRKRSQKEFGLISVSTGEGMNELFKALSVDEIITGGQTMNPSIDSIVHAVRKVNARNVFILPNNSNIILAATQAVELCDCHVEVLPTKTIPQGISAAMAFNPELSLEENLQNMTDAFQNVISGSVTYAVRETQINGQQIHNGDYIGILDGNLTVVSSEVEETGAQLIDKMIEKLGDEEASVTLYYGSDVAEEDANALAQRMEKAYPEAEFVVHNGGQPLYYYYFSVV